MPPDPRSIAFRPMRTDDLDLVGRWLHEPHVAAWWGPQANAIANIRGHLDEPDVTPFIVSVDGTPFAYIQLCDLSYQTENEPALATQPEGTFGIDQFIGPPHLIGKGLGTRLVAEMAEMVLKDRAMRVLVDPNPENRAAIRAYEKAGFNRLEIVEMTSGPALLMARDRQELK